MGNLLFSPSGRIGSADFIRGIIVLIVISAVLTVLPLISSGLDVLKILSIVMVWCWIVLYVKRFHDAGKTGWLTVAVAVASIILLYILSVITTKMFAADLSAQMQEVVIAATESGSFKDMMAMSQEFGTKIAKKTAIPTAIGTSILTYVVAMVVDKMFPRDPSDNQYGPAS